MVVTRRRSTSAATPVSTTCQVQEHSHIKSAICLLPHSEAETLYLRHLFDSLSSTDINITVDNILTGVRVGKETFEICIMVFIIAPR